MTNRSQDTRTAARAFAALWDGMSDLLGYPTTATLIRCATKQAASIVPELSQLAVTKQGFRYLYELPPSWNDQPGDAALAALVRALQPLLIELTGNVVLRRLQSIPDLRDTGLFAAEVAP